MRDDQSNNTKDELLQILDDLSENILNLTLNQQTVAALCRKVGEMEKLIALDAAEEDIDYDSDLDAEYTRRSHDYSGELVRPGPKPIQSVPALRASYNNMKSPSRIQEPQNPTASPISERVVKEAEILLARLSEAVSELRLRKEEIEVRLCPFPWDWDW